jgi:hypothetical protein
LLFNLIAERHERRSTIIATNLAFSERSKVLGNEKLTTLLDRLAARAQVLKAKGRSFRSRKRSAKESPIATPTNIDVASAAAAVQAEPLRVGLRCAPASLDCRPRFG